MKDNRCICAKHDVIPVDLDILGVDAARRQPRLDKKPFMGAVISYGASGHPPFFYGVMTLARCGTPPFKPPSGRSNNRMSTLNVLTVHLTVEDGNRRFWVVINFDGKKLKLFIPRGHRGRSSGSAWIVHVTTELHLSRRVESLDSP
jgi:hypothetical protein